MNKKQKFQMANSKIKKILAGGILVFGLGGAKYNANAVERDAAPTETTELSFNKLAKQTTQKATDYSAVKLNTVKDIEALFDKSLNFIFAELILEEVPMKISYDDYGMYKGKMNTGGVGSTYAPLKIGDYNKADAKWYHFASNQKTFASRKWSNEDMIRLVIGWAKYRQYTQKPGTSDFVKNKTVLNRMFDVLQGTSLTPNEFSALFCAVYNNESNIKGLCAYVKKNHANKFLCANEIMNWHKKTASNPGTKDRCEFESLVYLNANDFCESMLGMYTCPDRRASCIAVKGVKPTTLNKENYKNYSDKSKTKYCSVVYRSGAVKTGDICKAVSKYFDNPLYENQENENSLQKEYDKAISLYDKGQYQLCLVKLLDLEAKGASGVDLLNDIAITYYNLKDYDACIKYCQKVLKTHDKQAYAKACFNAGLAYEARKEYERAAKNFDLAYTYYENYGVFSENKKINYKSIYKNAKKRAEAEQEALKLAKQSKQR